MPPTRSLASVTITLGATSRCLVASAWAIQRPLIPPPTTTQSTMPDSPPSTLEEGIVGPSAMEQRSLKWLKFLHLRAIFEEERNGDGRRKEMSVIVGMAGGPAKARRRRPVTLWVAQPQWVNATIPSDFFVIFEPLFCRLKPVLGPLLYMVLSK